MTLRASNQVLCNVWSYDFYDTTLATELQRRHMMKFDLTLKKIKFSVSFILLFAIIKLLPSLGLSRQKT